MAVAYVVAGIVACILVVTIPFGVAAFGDFATRIRSNSMVQEKLEPYRLGGSVAQTLGAAER